MRAPTRVAAEQTIVIDPDPVLPSRLCCGDDCGSLMKRHNAPTLGVVIHGSRRTDDLAGLALHRSSKCRRQIRAAS